MEIIKNLIDPGKYGLKCPYEMVPEFIVVHNTANDASARDEIAYMIGNDKDKSFHYAVDEKEVVQGIPEDRNAWHAGDGKGQGNRKGIAVEICRSESGGDKFLAAEKMAAKFIAYKLKEKGWGMDRVKKHQDFSGKYCPHRTLDIGWERFLQMVQEELGRLTGAVLYEVRSVGTLEDKARAEAWSALLSLEGFAVSIAEVTPAPEPIPEPEPAPALKSLEEIAREVMNGDWGNGADRKNRLTEAGYDYAAVQKRVNELCGGVRP